MKIQRRYDDLEALIEPNKVLVIYGPRRVGKTTLLQDYLQKTKYRYRLDSGDNIAVQEILGSQDFNRLKSYAEGYDLIAIDEAQKISGIGEGLKILVDQVPNIRIIVTGSSSFELAGQIGEPLTGRKTTITMYPLAQLELRSQYNAYELKERLSEWLVYGSYPDIVTTESKAKKAALLEELVQSYMLKDILELERIKSAKILMDLVRLVAFQLGNEVSHSELAMQLGIDGKTVGRYLDLLEKSFILYNVRGYSRNLRKEITKKSKYYFYDNGIRNAVISNFNELEKRNDIGALWENFLMIERLKKRAYTPIYANTYFWRTHDGKEVDMVEERDGKLYGYECKWGKGDSKNRRYWLESYEEAEFDIITRENYGDLILMEIFKSTRATQGRG